jgi:putative ABC transport system permease protein
MFGTPSEMGPIGFDPSIFLLSGYLLALLAGLIALALGVGVATLPMFFLVLYAVEQGARLVAETTGAFVPKVVLIMFRGLRRSPLRTSLTYLALFVLTTVLVFLYSILAFIGNATAEKEANFKAVVTHKTVIPSQMPPKHYTEFKRLVIEELPKRYAAQYPGEPPLVIRESDIMSWSFVGGSTDPVNKRPDNALFMFCMEPEKIMTMMDGLDDLTGEERSDLERAVKAMLENDRRIVVSKSRLRKMNLEVGQKVTLYGLNYPDMVFDKLEIIGSLPDGKYEGVGFMNKAYLDRLLRDKPDTYVMKDKAVNLIWVKLPNKNAFQLLTGMVDPPNDSKETRLFTSPPIKLETASSGIGTWLEAYKDIFFGMKYILTPAMVGIMCLVIANAISIGVRERRTEMAVLKVLGFQPRHVMALVLGEAILVGVLAGGMAAFLSWAGIGNLKLQIAFFGAFFVPWRALVLGPLLGVCVAALGSIGPALSAKNVRVAEVFARVA